MATESFLSEFPPVSTEQWEHIIREKITGAEYASKLIWHPEEGFAVKPYYRAEDLAGLQFLDAAPGVFPFVRGARSTGAWRIREEIEAGDPEEANAAARAAVVAGAEEIAFRGTKVGNSEDLATVLGNLHEIPIAFAGAEPAVARLVMERIAKYPHGTRIAADLYPLADLELSAELVRDSPQGLKPFAIHADEFQERAAGPLEEVAFALSEAVDFLAEMRTRGLSVDRISSSLSFAFAMGPEFFTQIAKLRAFRLVWAKAVVSFGGTDGAARASIDARTAHWNETLYDPHVNILRATTEAISAILGDADSILVSPFDGCFRQPDESSRRLARNTQIILKQEAFLSRVTDPVGGSYVIEVLTNSIASKAWKLFQEIETAGGYRKAVETGLIVSVLEKRMRTRDEAAACRRQALTGTNRFADPREEAMQRVAGVATTTRVAQPFELLRLRTRRFIDRTGKKPRIVLAEMGDAKMRSARSQFAADFLACAGLVSSKTLFENARSIASCDADLIVLCSSDAEYLSIVIELMPMLKRHDSSPGVVVAGNPETAEQLRDIGIFDFIHLRSNAIAVLGRIQKLMGIED